MANFGDVLRGLGSVLNPQVAEQVAAEDRQREQQQAGVQSLLLKQLLEGVQSGAVDPSRLPPQLAGIVGPSPEAQARQVAINRQRGRDAFFKTPEAQDLVSKGDVRGLTTRLIGANLVDDPIKALDEARKMITAGQRVVPAGSSIVDESGNVITRTPEKTKPIRRYQSGENMITEEQQPDGTWAEIARGPRFAFADRPQTDIGRLNADLKAGRITQAQYDAAAGIKLGTTGRLTPEAIDAAAARYNIDGTTPSNLGRGVQGSVNMSLILSKAAQNSFDQGDTAEGARLRQIANKSASSALGQLSKQKNLILAFEKNAIMNADLVLDRSEKVDRLGSPVIDRWIQAGKKNIAGDVGVAELDTAMRTFINEYARVTTTVTGGGVTSDTARHEIDGLLRSAQTKEQVRGVIKLMKQEMDNRRIGYEQQEQELLSGISRGPRNAATSAPAAPVLPPPGQPQQGQPSVDDLVKKYGGR